ncbi:hypothetical protein UFOVP501_4 [uncultured Caudovirales phage]|uniref:Uncharacterized protein n=1 Tax=uncultured Caudovirales phage TaxID=2100421 RepID=A0A6J5MI07_9CAUD|nr:hypothetical protein UFOVP501_4 [uncultured Caudovirales phage]CAB4161369.1 hypothetical protein UFOVP762_47 [uncultured Caudovirales phage]CAB4187136.1 hypothetical protein UFOVP1161_4 [uncultured Caudovirales phage]
MLTIDEQERQAIWAGDTAMALALGRIIDLEQERLKLRQLVREAQDYVEDADWRARAAAALED